MTAKVTAIIFAMGLGVATMAGCSSSNKPSDEVAAPVTQTGAYEEPTALQAEPNSLQNRQIASLGASSSGLSH